jgi:hypothetical protein
MTISLLSKHLPSGWKIYVKENPFQFLTMDPHQRDFKGKLFYKLLSEIPEVRLVSMKHNSFELIDNSVAVATLTGMTGWEAINRGKPVLSFGFGSYRYCDGVFSILNEKDLKTAVEKLLHNLIIPDITKIRFYLYLLYKNSSPGIIKNFEFDIYKIEKNINDDSWYAEIMRTL